MVQLSKRIPVRKPKVSHVIDFVQCPSCGALVGRKNYSRHNRACTGRKPNRQRVLFEALTKKRVDISSGYVEDKLLEEFLIPLKHDQIGKTIREDTLLLLMARHFALAHKGNPQRTANSRSNIRQLAQLFTEMQFLNPTVTEFMDCLEPTKYRTPL